jgi:putative addiction module component (TIGR02574 family)
MSYDEIVLAALALPQESRAMLAEQLYESFDTNDQARLDAIWLAEVEGRDKEIEDGFVEAIPGEEVMRRLFSRSKE